MGPEGGEGVGEGKEEAHRLRNLVAFILGLGVGVEGQAVPRLPGGVFVVVMDMVMPSWDPLRKGVKGLEYEGGNRC